MPAPDEITVSCLDRLIGTPDCPEIVDLSLDEDVAADPFLIPGAWRHDHRDLPGLARRLDGGRAVIVCQKGRKLSQGGAAWLASEGIEASFLQGGNHGWRDGDGTMRIPLAELPDPASPTLWVTRHRPRIDRIACPWLVRRFIDRRARFLFVAPAEVADVADRFRAIPFDVDGARYTHRGAECTFDALLADFALTSAPLARLATVIRGADTDRHELHPAAAGLLALSVGLSRLHRGDQAQLAAGLPLYDALYRWARDGANETHDCHERSRG
ncbi:chromate resistance protein [Roseovarius sp. SCSIO 43702]|uniref:chromate resistance protein ChrB domain-containing protein n=1 Tax=Roseovarius sp. SCSIO 43702 TaxID=2823043 RepID=UPI001C72E5B6|nr:chromate resistance protein ChrB domain-containing protein [Roseovarius sp. SCSIO 43702]QYX55725.1 chromate resistance protein [Roseovarius sp. SCSIO 43702]